MRDINWATLIVALLGAAKLVLESFGINIITDDQINAIANAAAAVAAVIGVVMSHRKGGNSVADTYDYAELDSHSKDA